MEIIKYGKKEISILSKQEILEKGKTQHEKLIANPLTKEIYKERYYKCLLDEPMPYKLFRLNELFSHSLNYVGVEISFDQYSERLGQLPPESFNYKEINGYIVPECVTEDIFEHLFVYKHKYYCCLLPKLISENQTKLN